MGSGLQGEIGNGNVAGNSVKRQRRTGLDEIDGRLREARYDKAAFACFDFEARPDKGTVAFDIEIAGGRQRRIADAVIVKSGRHAGECCGHDVAHLHFDRRHVRPLRQRAFKLDVAGGVGERHVGRQRGRKPAVAAQQREIGVGRFEGDAVDFVNDAECGVIDGEAAQIGEDRHIGAAVDKCVDHRADDKSGLGVVNRCVSRGKAKRETRGAAEQRRLDAIEFDRGRRDLAAQQGRHAEAEGDLGQCRDAVAVGACDNDIHHAHTDLTTRGVPAQNRVANFEAAAVQIAGDGVLHDLAEDGQRDGTGRQTPSQDGKQHCRCRNGNANHFQSDFTGTADQGTSGLLWFPLKMTQAVGGNTN